MKKSADSNASTPPPAPLPQSSPAIHLNRVPAQTHISVSLEVTRCTYTHIHTRAHEVRPRHPPSPGELLGSKPVPAVTTELFQVFMAFCA